MMMIMTVSEGQGPAVPGERTAHTATSPSLAFSQLVALSTLA